MCVLSAVPRAQRAGCDPGSVPGFPLEAPAQETHLGSGHATSVWDWNVLGKGFALWGSIIQESAVHNETSSNSLQGKGAGRWSLTLAGTYLYISQGSSQAKSYAHAISHGP